MTTHMSIPGPQVLLPMVIILSTFVFVLSVILIAKSPKAGACLVGGLIFALPILLYRAAMGGLFSTPMGLPFVIIPGTFLFVLLVVVLSKAPKAGAALIVLLVVMGLFGMFFGVRVAASIDRSRFADGRGACRGSCAVAGPGDSTALGDTGPDLVGRRREGNGRGCLSVQAGGRPGARVADRQVGTGSWLATSIRRRRSSSFRRNWIGR